MSIDRGHIRGQSGFSMLEVAMGVMVLALGIVPLLNVLNQGVKGTQTVHHLTRSLQMARSALAVAEALSYDQLTDAKLAELVGKIPPVPGVNAPRLEPIITTPVPSTAPVGRIEGKVVTVRVTWKPESGLEEEEVVLRTMVVKPP